MAEFLIYNKDHWMDALSAEEIAERAKTDHFQQKYDARYQRGDIVEVCPDGFWTDGKRKGFGKEHFALVIVPGLNIRKAKKYMEERFKEVVRERNFLRTEYLKDSKVDYYKHEPILCKEYTVLTEIPGLGMVDVEWVTLSGVIDVMDRRRKYQMDMGQISLSVEKKAVLTTIKDAHIIDKGEI